MGPKKGKDKKGGGDAAGGELDDKAVAKMWELTSQSLQLQLAERSEEASKAIAAKRELSQRVSQISTDYEEEKEMTFQLTQDMTRQYKGMQEELLGRINTLEETVQELRDNLSDADVRLDRTLKEKNAIIDMKDKEIEDLRIKMDDMADEFGEMLRETLEKMRERIGVTSGNFDAPDVPIQRRMEEMKVAAEEK